MAGDGYKVVGMSRNKGEAYEDLMSRLPGQVEFQPLDLSDIDSIAGVARETTKKSGPVYGLVNNAGIGLDGVLATMLQTDLDRVFRTNLLGPITLTKHIMRSMLSKREGRIVNVSSIVASTGFHGLSVYAATKAGLEGFTRSLSREAGKRNITVNCVAPGYLETEMMAGFPSEKLESLRRRAPLGLPHPEHVAGAISYLLKPEACTITGTVLTVDGGSSA
jgi:3-oxoacyl-[acyl-carrier protein] reductase